MKTMCHPDYHYNGVEWCTLCVSTLCVVDHLFNISISFTYFYDQVNIDILQFLLLKILQKLNIN